MINITNNPKDGRYVFMLGDYKDLQLVEQNFNRIPQYMFLPSYPGIPKPTVFIHRQKKDDKFFMWTYSGMWREIIDYCKSANIEYKDSLTEEFKHRRMVSFDTFASIVAGWHLKLEPREYQLKAAWRILNFNQSLSQIATRAGKTLIFYIVARWMREQEHATNILMIVPSTMLVKQGVADLTDYKEYFNIDTVWGGGKESDESNLTIGTFQSLTQRINKNSKKYDPSFFDKFDVVCVDEAHHLKCASIESILKQPFIKNAKLQFGFTGTLPKENTIESFECHLMMGPKIQEIKTEDIVNEGFICNAHVTQVKLDYGGWIPSVTDAYIKTAEYVLGNYVLENGNKVMLPEDKRLMTMIYKKKLPSALEMAKALSLGKRDWAETLVGYARKQSAALLNIEQLIVQTSQRRTEAIAQLTKMTDGNGLVFGHHTEYLKYLYRYFKDNCPDREVYLMTGSTKTKDRDDIKQRLLETDNAILVASYGVLSTGVTLKNVNWAIFSESFKSEIINKQSIGRGLLKAEGKDYFYVYDIVDLLPTKKLEGHGKTKANSFKEDKFIVKYETINLY